MKIKYIIITRFNLDYKKIVKENLKADPEEWLENRIKLFFKYCYPSILNQSDKDFEWWIFFDLQTSGDIINVIRDRDIAGIIKFKFSSWAEFRKDILIDLNSIPETYDYLLNARIDSDDAISKFNIAEIKKYFFENINHLPESFILNPLKGLVYHTETTVLYKKNLKNNPFQVLAQKSGIVKNSVFTFQHQTALNHFSVFNISTIPFWLMIVHGDNWLNVRSGRPITIRGDIVNKHFSFLKLPNDQLTIFLFIKEYLFYLNSMKSKLITRLKSYKNKILC